MEGPIKKVVFKCISRDNYEQKKRKRSSQPEPQDSLNLACLCLNCDFQTTDYNALIKHIDNHATADLCVDGEHRCLWDFCMYVAPDVKTLQQHLKYHVYHAKLKSIGTTVKKRLNLPTCKQFQRFKLTELPEYYQCDWTSCGLKLQDYQDYLYHVKCHVIATPKNTTASDPIKCEWFGCTNQYPFQYRLSEHVKTHTKEKFLACPSCGFMFSSNTKFADHCRKQLAEEQKSFQCSQCFKLFASERLLRDHMRSHVNHYKCHLCEMTCTTPSALSKHIRYRHLTERPFKCDICSHSTVSAQDLRIHRETHSNESKYQCVCGYKCRSKFTFNRHIKVVHEDDLEYKYACHCCEKVFPRGVNLTKHLRKEHHYQWPMGHSRFSYKLNAESGKYLLTVIRYESLDVMQDSAEGGSVPMDDAEFHCEQSKDNPLCYELKVSASKNDETA